MLRITTEERDASVRLLLEGKLSGPWVAELERAFSDSKSTSVGRPIVLDLSGLVRADAAGRSLLEALHREGVKFENSSPLARGLLSKAVLAVVLIATFASWISPPATARAAHPGHPVRLAARV